MSERLEISAEHPGAPAATLVASYSPAGSTAIVALHGASTGTRTHRLFQGGT